MKHAILTILTFAVLFVGQPARALVVFDPSNYRQNVLTAVRALEQINNQIRSIQNEVVMLQNMAKNLQRLDYSSLGQITGALHNISDLMTQGDSLSFDLAQLESQWREQYPQTYDASLSTSDIAIAARLRWQNAMAGFRQAMQVQAQIARNVQDDQSLLADLVNHSQGAGGALEAQQAASQLLAFSAKQQMQIQEIMAAQYRAEAQDAARKAQSEEAARIATKKFLGGSDAYKGN